MRCSLYRHQSPISGEGFYYTSQSLSTVWSSVSECQQQHILSFLSFCVPPSLQVSVFQVPVLEGEPLLLSLAPFLVVKVNVSALREQQSGKNKKTLINTTMTINRCAEMNPHLFKLIGDGLGLLVPLEPHHVLGVKPPGLFLQSLCRQILSLGTLREKSIKPLCSQTLTDHRKKTFRVFSPFNSNLSFSLSTCTFCAMRQCTIDVQITKTVSKFSTLFRKSFCSRPTSNQ